MRPIKWAFGHTRWELFLKSVPGCEKPLFVLLFLRGSNSLTVAVSGSCSNQSPSSPISNPRFFLDPISPPNPFYLYVLLASNLPISSSDSPSSPLLDRWSLSPILRKFLSRRNFRVSLILCIVSSISRVLSFDFRRFADGRGSRSEILGLRGFDSSGRDVLAYGGAVHHFAGEFNLISSLCNFISFFFFLFKFKFRFLIGFGEGAFSLSCFLEWEFVKILLIFLFG